MVLQSDQLPSVPGPVLSLLTTSIVQLQAGFLAFSMSKLCETDALQMCLQAVHQWALSSLPCAIYTEMYPIRNRLQAIRTHTGLSVPKMTLAPGLDTQGFGAITESPVWHAAQHVLVSPKQMRLSL